MAHRETRRETLNHINTDEINEALAVLDAVIEPMASDDDDDGLADWARTEEDRRPDGAYRLAGEQVPADTVPLAEPVQLPDSATPFADEATATIIDRPPAETADTAEFLKAMPTDDAVDPLADTQPMPLLDDDEPEAVAVPDGPTPAPWTATVPLLTLPATINSGADWRRPLPPACGPISLGAPQDGRPNPADLSRSALEALEGRYGPTDLPDLTDCAVMLDESGIEIADDAFEPIPSAPPAPPADPAN